MTRLGTGQPRYSLVVSRTAFGLGPDQAERIVRWSDKAAARRRTRSPRRVDRGEAPGDMIEVLRSFDRTTGEIIPADRTPGHRPKR